MTVDWTERSEQGHLTHDARKALPKLLSQPPSLSQPELTPPSPVDTYSEQEVLVLEPETRPITQAQLITEVKGIYAGLVMVERKCEEIDHQQSATINKLTNEQWQALIALHRTLLQEHHDFFLASQHPSATPALKRLATKYAMPARMWRHGIHSFLELLRHRLPHSSEHMLSFTYLAYSMITLLLESVPSFEETWIECLGDLARYRMAIEETDARDREIWAGVARMWYEKAADKSPSVGRIQHHLAVLSRPHITQQLFHYSKSLVSVTPFPNTRESVMLLFNPFLADPETAAQRYPLAETLLVRIAAISFTCGAAALLSQLIEQYVGLLPCYIEKMSVKFRALGPELASTYCALLFDFGNVDSYLSKAFAAQAARLKVALETIESWSGHPSMSLEQMSSIKEQQRQAYFQSLDISTQPANAAHSTQDSTTKDATFSGSPDAVAQSCHLFYLANDAILRAGVNYNAPYAHVILAFLNSLTYVPEASLWLEKHVPWENITNFLNDIGRSGIRDSLFESSIFPEQQSGTGRQLGEDFVMRGLSWSVHYFPPGFFHDPIVEEAERTLELPSHTLPRAVRCLWLGVQLASLRRWILYDPRTKRFSTTEFALALEASRLYNGDNRSPTISVEPEDMIMANCKS